MIALYIISGYLLVGAISALVVLFLFISAKFKSLSNKETIMIHQLFDDDYSLSPMLILFFGAWPAAIPICGIMYICELVYSKFSQMKIKNPKYVKYNSQQ